MKALRMSVDAYEAHQKWKAKEAVAQPMPALALVPLDDPRQFRPGVAAILYRETVADATA